MSGFNLDELDMLDGIFAWDNGCRSSGLHNPEFKQYLRDRKDYASSLLTELCKIYLDDKNKCTFEDMIRLVKWAEDELDIC